MDELIQTAVQRPIAVELELFPVKMPFSEIAQRAMGSTANGLGMAIPSEEPWEAGDFVIARLVDEDGTEGWSEVFMWLPETGVSPDEVMLSVPRHLARYVLGRSPADVRAIRAQMDRNVARNEVGKAVLDMACLDLAARQIGRPVHDLIGGTGAAAVALAALVPLVDPGLRVKICGHFVEQGYRTLRIKLGESPEQDLEVMQAIRDRVGPDVRLRVDYNGAYAAAESIRALRMLEPVGIEAAEQPLPVADVLAMARVQSQTSIPLFLHEGAFSVADVTTLVELGGCQVVGINMERPGGMIPALALSDWAAVRGMGTIVHNQNLGIGTAAHLHFAAARYDQLGHAPELAGETMFENSLTSGWLEISDGEMTVPTGPGWGVEIDRDALDRYLAADPVTVTIDDVRGGDDGSAS